MVRRGRLMLLSCAASRYYLASSFSAALQPTASSTAVVHRRPLILLSRRALAVRADASGRFDESSPLPQLAEEWTPPEGFSDWDEDELPPMPQGDGAASGFPPPLLDERAPAPRRGKLEPTFIATLEMPVGTCSGCGARFQFEEVAAPGYMPAEAYEKKLALIEEGGGGESSAGQREAPLCQRCHGLRFQNRLPVDALRVGSDATQAELQPEHFLRLLRDVARTRCVVVAIVDLFDFHGSLVPNLASVVGDDNALILVGNKFDLLPAGVDAKRIERWVRKEARRAALPELTALHLVSCQTGVGMPRLLDELKDLMLRKRLDAYVVGAANAGKSSFINHVLRSVAPGRSVTTSPLPGTTLDFVRVNVLAGRYALYDTPGVILPNQITTSLTTDELAQVVPKKRAQHVTLRVKEGKSVLLGGIARLHLRAGLPYLFTFYLANAVQIHPTDSAKVDDVLLKHAGGMLAPPASYERLAELGDFDETTFEIAGRGWDEAACDIVLPGLGWVAVTGCGPCTVGVCLPRPVVPLRREPIIPTEGGGIKGTMKGSYAKYTGTKLRNGKRQTKRQPLRPRS